MEAENKKNCCQGCKAGQPGSNESCKAKLLLEQMQQGMATKTQDNNTINSTL